MSDARSSNTLPGLEMTHLPPEAQARRFFLFLVTGGLAAVVNLVSRYLLTPIVGFQASIVIAYLMGMIVAFILFRSFVFGKSDKSMAKESYRFVVVNMIALALVWCITMLLTHIIFPAIRLDWHAEDIAHFIGTCVPAVTSFVGHSFYTFSKQDGSRANSEVCSDEA